MKTIENILDTVNKFGDTETVFRLRLKDGDDYVSLGNKPVILNIANFYGLVLSMPLTDQSGDTIELDFKSQELSKLTPDAYKLEFEVTMVDGDVAKFPTKDGLPFHITNNLKQTQGALIPTITFDDVLSAVDDKVNEYIHTIQKGDKGDKGDTGASGQNGKDGDVMQSKDNTFTGKNIFEIPIDGRFLSRAVTFNDYSDVAHNMDKYTGDWFVTTQDMANGPLDNGNKLYWYQVTVKQSYGTITGSITITLTDGRIFVTGVDGGSLKGWNLIPKDSTVVHNTGTETLAGDKTFTGNTNLTGQTTLQTGNYGLRVTTTGIQKTSDNGVTWVNI